MPLITLRGITKAFAGTVALGGVDLELYPAEVHALVGENGSGKSTLLRVAAGVHRPTSGAIAVDGAEREYHRPADATADGIVLVTQEGSLVLDLSVTENIYVGRLTKQRGRVDWPGMHRKARALLATLGVEIDPQRPTRSLPPDLRQLVEIARALSYDSRVLLLDEPTSALDPQETERLLRTIRALADRGLSVVIVSHRMPEILSVSDRFTVLRDGTLIGTRTRDETDEAWLVRAMVGRDLHRVSVGAPPEKTPQQQPVLDVRDLRDHGGRLREISLTVSPGEIVGLAGIVGAGRSEILETIVGARPRAGGNVHVDGAPVGHGVRAALASGIVLVAEDRKQQALLATRSVQENATLTLPVGGGLLRRRTKETAAALPWLERLGTKYASLEQPIGALSGGNQQKVLLTRAMVLSPKLLMLDEPTRGIDLGAKQRIYEEVIELAGAGIGILVASSELPELLALCHRVLVIREGEVAAELEQHELSEESIVIAATGATQHA
ncbi:MAG TPA: sugar ABC transporter ATP-binding protein [Conexibacter sp.]|jgi:ABC-type sugar transport system ATPase subunit